MTENIFDFIPNGAENAISADALTAILGFKDSRSLRAAILNLRRQGHVIAGTKWGYYIPCDISELREYLHTAEMRGRTTFTSVRAARKALKAAEAQTDGQLSLNL